MLSPDLGTLNHLSTGAWVFRLPGSIFVPYNGSNAFISGVRGTLFDRNSDNSAAPLHMFIPADLYIGAKVKIADSSNPFQVMGEVRPGSTVTGDTISLTICPVPTLGQFTDTSQSLIDTYTDGSTHVYKFEKTDTPIAGKDSGIDFVDSLGNELFVPDVCSQFMLVYSRLPTDSWAPLGFLSTIFAQDVANGTQSVELHEPGRMQTFTSNTVMNYDQKTLLLQCEARNNSSALNGVDVHTKKSVAIPVGWRFVSIKQPIDVPVH